MIKHNTVVNEEPYLFVSYSRKDTEYVKKAIELLEKDDFRIWYDDSIAEEGEQDFEKVLCKKIQDCCGVILFISQGSMSSVYCGKELLNAFKYDKKVFSFALLEDDKQYASTKNVTDVIPEVLHSYVAGNSHIPQYEKKGYPGEFEEEEWKKKIKDLSGFLPEIAKHDLDFEDEEEKTRLKKCRDGRRFIEIPQSVKIIMSEAFCDCETLEKIDLKNVERIEESAFESCDELVEIYIPDTVKMIGENAFKDCDKVNELRLPQYLDSIGEGAFDGCAEITSVIMPRNLLDIPSRMFSGCELLETVEFYTAEDGKGVVSIGESAFEGCKKLLIDEEHPLPRSLRIIDYQGMANCDSIEILKLPERMRKIGKNAFKDCDELRHVEIGAWVEHIANSPFRGCKKLNNIVVDASNKFYRTSPISDADGCVHNALFNKNRSELICFPAGNGAEEYEIPDSVTTIAGWSFAYCNKLKNIMITDSVDVMGENAFYGCTSLEEVYIPEGVNIIDDMVFRKCKNLKYVYIPMSVERIGYAIFNGCSEVVLITPKGSKAETIFGSGKQNNIKFVPLEDDQLLNSLDEFEEYINGMKEL